MSSTGATARPQAPPLNILREWVSPLLAEFIGTFSLIFMGAGAIIMTGGQNLVAIALAHGLGIGLAVAAAGHISGGAYNPAVTIGLLIGQKIKPEKAVAYIVVELAGAVCAALVLKAIFPENAVEAVKLGVPGVGKNIHLGNITVNYSAGRAFLSEIVLSFFLMYVIYGVAVDKRGPGAIAALAIGLTITMDIFANGDVGGAAMNPARHFGPALVGNVWDNGWIWYTAPFIGMAIAAGVQNYIFIASAKSD